MPLAIQSYLTHPALADSDETLVLSWTSDERGCLDRNVAAVLAGALAEEASGGLPQLGQYWVKDPYGEGFLGPAVRRFFDLPEEGSTIFCGAGVNSLLHALAALGRERRALIAGSSYPDLPYWVAGQGGTCFPIGTAPQAWAASDGESAVWRDAGLVFLERPSLIANRLADTEDIRRLCDIAGRRGVPVLIDESNANYAPPSFSAVPFTAEFDNLIVLRGFSKAYGLGGLRLGYAIASEALRRTLAAIVPPLLASSLSLYLGRTILDLGDIGIGLRRAISDSKQEATTLFHTSGIDHATPSSGPLPYLFLEADDPAIETHLAPRGILGKQHLQWSPEHREVRPLYRLSVPLAPARRAALRARLRP
ncbi:MAG: aminotransferase class I/II-fold pyridoxal phosphate-dependent enzyme [Alphaproteobacteria bacterium]|nr:aminotransferase class I/II-fold pyridoxal phosphate-dependent enzyme [Alphaproteobacteria bacterium]